MKIEIVSFMGSREKWAQAVADEYCSKASRFRSTKRVTLKTPKSSDGQRKQMIEGEELLKYIDGRDFVVLCDEKGQQLPSVDLAKKMENWMMQSGSRLIFVIGGAFGFNAEVRKRANYEWSLSKLTFNHLIAEVVLCEQIYRALSIQNNHPYHNE